MDRLLQFIDGEVQLLGYGFHWTQPIRDTPMFPIPLIRNVVAGTESASVFCILQYGLDFRRRPDEKFSFDSFRIRIRRGIKSSGRVGHFPENIVKHVRRNVPIGDPLCDLIALQVGSGQEGIVVQHLLEMRNQPALVGGVACEPTADMIVDPPCRHSIERTRDHLQSSALSCPTVTTEEQREPCRRGEFRRAAKSAVALIEILTELRHRLVKEGNTD